MRMVAGIAVFVLGALVGACSSESQPTSTAPILSTTSVPSTTESPTTTVTPPTSEGSATTEAPPDSTSTTTTAPLDELRLALVEVAAGFDAPVLLVADPDEGPDLIVEQPGRVIRVDDQRTPVLDIRSDVVYGGERGLLGLAFHPDFSTNRLAYVNYVGAGGRTVIEQFAVADDGAFDVGSRLVVLTIDQPAANHNGGMIAFGPDGHLWIGMGDGGGSNDRFGQGQRPDTLLGAMLRIAVGVEGVERYAIPPDNPYADGAEGAPEVWAIGLRNPWRFSFDGSDVWIADVGQGSREEVNLTSASLAAANYGWPVMEGSECFRSSTCDATSLVVPVTDYGHDAGCSVTGGYVYRGTAMPELGGQYFFSDYCTGSLWSYSEDAGLIDWTPQVGAVPNPSGFGVGGDGELYAVSHQGVVLRLERAS